MFAIRRRNYGQLAPQGRGKFLWLCLFLISWLSVKAHPLTAGTVDNSSSPAEQASVEEHVNQPIDLELHFTDSQGQLRTLRQMMVPERPLLILPVYFTCPRLCPLSLAGMRTLIGTLPLLLGQDYAVAAISFDDRDTPAGAEAISREYLKGLDQQQQRYWTFGTGTKPAIAALMGQIGFHYLGDQGQFIHSAMFVIATPDGRIARYFYGIKHDPGSVRYAVVEASNGRVGSTVDRIMMYCFHFDAKHGRYTPLVMNIVRVVGSLTALALAGVVLLLRCREVRAQKTTTRRSAADNRAQK